MNSYSLSVYKVTIYKHFKRSEPENLSDYNNGSKLLEQIDNMFVPWKENIVGAGYKDEKVQKVNRIMKKSGEYIYHKHATYIDGIIESGDYGTQEEIVDIETGESKYTKMPQDATLYPFYFMLYVEPNAKEGYIILERIGNIGIMSVLEKAMGNFLVDGWKDNYTLRIEPFVVPEILNINFSKTNGAKRIVLKGVAANQFKSMSISDTFQGCKTDISFSAPRDRNIMGIEKLIKSLKDKKDDEPYRVNNIECHDVAFVLDMNGKQRTVSMANVVNIGMNINITDSVVLDASGYPAYNSLNKEAHKVLSYFTKNEGDG